MGINFSDGQLEYDGGFVLPDLGEEDDNDTGGEVENGNDPSDIEGDTDDSDVEGQEVEDSEVEDEGEETPDEVKAQLGFINQLKGYGLELTSEDIEDADGDLSKALSVNVAKKAEAMLDNYFSKLGEAERNAMNLIFQGATIEDLLDLNKDNFTVTKEQIESDPDLQEKVIREDLESKGLTKRQIDNVIKSLGDDKSEDALEAYERLSANKAAQKEQKLKSIEDRKKENEAKVKQVVANSKANLGKVESFIPNVKMDKKTKESIEVTMFDTYNEITTNPDKYIPVLGILKHYGILDGNFKAVTAVKETSANKNLVQALQNQGKKRKTQTSGTSDNDLLSDLRKYFKH